MKNFKTPLAIKGSKYELLALVPELERLGYEIYGSCQAMEPLEGWGQDELITNYSNKGTGYLGIGRLRFDKEISVSAKNKELVLALAAMTHEGGKGEWYINISGDSYGGRFTEGKLYKLISDNLNDEKSFTDNSNRRNGWQENNHLHFRQATAEEIIDHFNEVPLAMASFASSMSITNTADINPLGYELIKEYPNHKGIGKKAMFEDVTDFEWEGADTYSQFPEFWKPIYKPKSKIMTLNKTKGTFEVHVSKDGVYYAPDNRWLNLNDLRDAILHTMVRRGETPNNFKDGNDGYFFKPTTIDCGCMKGVPVEDWDNVLKEQAKIQ